MSTAPIPPVVRSPLVRGVTDASQNRSKQFIPSAYAMGKLFTGVTLQNNIDLNTYVTPGVSRLDTYKNGPPVTSSGYLVIHTVNPDEDKSSSKYQYRQIYYPDSTTETTPYTRVGTSTDGKVITWSAWTTMGGNWMCEILSKDKIGIANYMYHSFNNWTLTLPDPKSYAIGTRIGLTQWMGKGKVVWGTNEQVTTADISEEGTTVGALQYIFQIVPDAQGTNIWALDVDNNIDGTIDTLVRNFQSKVDTINATVTNLTNRFVEITNRKQPLVRHLTIASNFTFIADAVASDPNAGHNIEFFDYVVIANANCTITLPSSTSRKSAHITIMVAPGQTVNVTWPSATETISEAFQNTDTSAQLVLDFMTHDNPSGTNDWSVLEVG